jgi:tetratricopeptide (TPR) repeat protein
MFFAALVLIVAAGQAETAYEDSVALYGMGKLDASLARLEVAEKEAADPRLLAKIHRQKAFIFERRGEKERAIDAFVQALRLDPKISVDPRQHRPEVIALFECAQKKDRGQSCEERPPSLVITTPPPLEEDGDTIRSWAWAPAAAGVVFGGAATFFFLRSNARHEALTSPNPPMPFVPPEQLRDEGPAAQTLGVVFIAAGSTALASAALMYFFGGEP